MNEKMLKSIAVMGLVPALVLANPSFMDDQRFMAEPPCKSGMSQGRHGLPDGEHLPPYLHHLDLTDAQQDSIKKLLQANKTAMDAQLKTGKEGFAELNGLALSDDYSEEKAAALIDKSAAFHRQMALQKTQLDHAIFQLLTPEQQQKLKTDMAGKH